MGVVWEARDELLQRTVAVKQLRLIAGFSEEEAELAKQRAMREARITARLHHPHAVPVFDAVEHDGEPCLVMQYVPSEPLSALIRRRAPLPAGEVARIGAEVASALAAAHALGIVHRDVKPGNILIADADGTALLSDFGISHATGDATLTSTGFVHGTPAYLAPEVARGEDSTPASDVFSLGSTLYAASEGRAPFGEEPNSIAVLHRVASGGFQAPKESGPLGPLLLQMMASDPADRPTMAQVARRLAAVQAEADDVPVPTLPLVSDAEPDVDAEDDPDQPTAWVPVPEEHTATLVVEPAAASTAGAPTRPAPTVTAPEPLAPAAAEPVAAEPAAPEPVLAGPPPAELGPEDEEARPRRRRGLAVLIAAVAVVLVALGGFGLLRAVQSGDGPAPTRSAPAAAATRTPAASPSRAPSSAAPSPSVTASPSATPSPTSTPSSPSSSPTPTATSAPAAGAATPVAAIRRYYSLVPGNTAAAWQLLTAGYQQNHAGGRASYDEFWRPVRSISATDVRSIGSDAVEATLTYRRSDGSVTVEDTTFRLVRDGGVLKIADSDVVSSR
ncbi:serine/threonine protein kinase [Amnibacterium setariae]|uniref:non-specific serine/threonine protein kinase n=2 Tax=Amnibacterium setariae TaxID=2306585 RepID=A0A3A1TYL8_9MICO|nr:serine/threonine protein kinase [Amnibacterium setariae]